MFPFLRILNEYAHIGDGVIYLACAILPAPYAMLAAAAGAMVYVVIEEVIPEANASGNGNAATVACIGGLCLVMSFSSLVG